MTSRNLLFYCGNINIKPPPPKQPTTELVVNILCMDEGEEKDNYCLKALEPHFLLFPEMFQMT